jgi:hypothetical protein
MRDEYGLISNEVLVENNAQQVVQPEPSPIRGINMDEGTILTTVCLKSLILYFLFCIFLNYRSVIYCGLNVQTDASRAFISKPRHANSSFPP